MATPAILDSSTEKPTPVIETGVVASEVLPGSSVAQETLEPTPTVESTVAAIAGTVGQHMDIAEVSAATRNWFNPLIRKYTLVGGGIEGESVTVVSSVLDELIAVRKSRAELRV